MGAQKTVGHSHLGLFVVELLSPGLNKAPPSWAVWTLVSCVSQIIVSSFVLTAAHLNVSFGSGTLMFLSLQAPDALYFIPTLLQLSLILPTSNLLFTLGLAWM